MLRAQETRLLDSKISLSNRFIALQDGNTENSANSLYNNFEQACAHAAEEVIPLKPKARHRIPWETEDIVKKRDDFEISHAEEKCRSNTRKQISLSIC